MNPITKTLLVVDDDEGMRDTLHAILKRDYRVLMAVTGEEALTVLKKEDIDPDIARRQVARDQRPGGPQDRP